MAPVKTPSLKTGRPPHAKKTSRATISSQDTRKIIREHHDLNKKLAKAETVGDQDAVATIKQQLTDLGGLPAYQRASIQGQSADRGGDSSAILMAWLKPHAKDLLKARPRLLEIGALSTKNACAKSGLFDIVRIDLNSQTEGILQQDFMLRPLPKEREEYFDFISLSLVLNYVPESRARGEMLRRTTAFLRRSVVLGKDDALGRPGLFLVLPAPCVDNSRYFNVEQLTLIMASLGYVLLRAKRTEKLVYNLWQMRDQPVAKREQVFPKMKVRVGGGKNNFCVELRRDAASGTSVPAATPTAS